MALEFDRVIQTGTTTVQCITYSPDRRELYTGSSEPEIRVWSADDGRPLKELKAHRGRVSAVLYCGAHKVLFSGSLDHTLLVWSPAKSEVLSKHKFGSPVFSLSYNKRLDQLYAGGDSGVYVYSVSEKGKARLRPMIFFQDHSDFVTSIVTTDSGRAYTCGFDNVVCSYEQNLQNIPDRIGSQECHDRGITTMDIDPNTNTLITGSYDMTAKVWASDQRKNIRNMQTLDLGSTVTSVAYVSVTGSVWVASKNNPPAVFDPRTGTNLTEFLPHEDEAEDLSFTKFVAVDGGLTVFGLTEGRQVAIWKYNPHAAISVMHGHTDWVECIAVFPHHPNRVVSGGGDSVVRMWEAPSHMYPGLMTMSGAMTGHRGAVLCCAFADDGDTLVTGSDDCTLRVWNVTEDPEKLNLGDPCKFTLSGHTARVSGIALLGHTAISTSWDRSIRLWDMTTGEVKACIQNAHDSSINGVASAPELGHFATCSGDRIAYLWSLEERKAIAACQGHEADISHVCWNAVLQQWVTVSDDMTVRLWSTEGKNVATMIVYAEGGFTALCCDAKTGYVLVGLRDYTMRVLDVANDIMVQAHRGHNDAIRAIVHVPEKNMYITGSWDHTLRAWTIRRRAPKAAATTGTGAATAGAKEKPKAAAAPEAETAPMASSTPMGASSTTVSINTAGGGGGNKATDNDRAPSYSDLHPILEPKSLSRKGNQMLSIPTRSAGDANTLTALDLREDAKRQSRCYQMLRELEDELSREPHLARALTETPSATTAAAGRRKPVTTPATTSKRVPPRSKSTEPWSGTDGGGGGGGGVGVVKDSGSTFLTQQPVSRGGTGVAVGGKLKATPKTVHPRSHSSMH